MGLAEPRKRVKISHDPNNTKWARSENGFGRKILISQGWTSDSCLGARNAPQASDFTTGSASPIRISVKEDRLGLGARIGGERPEDQKTGHDAFQGLLGRLNGKSETDIAEEQMKRVNERTTHYLRSRYNFIHFVRGGLLVQDNIARPNSPIVGSLKTSGDESQDLTKETQKAKDSGDARAERKKERQEKASKRKRKHVQSEKAEAAGDGPSTGDEKAEPSPTEIRIAEKCKKKRQKKAKKQGKSRPNVERKSSASGESADDIQLEKDGEKSCPKIEMETESKAILIVEEAKPASLNHHSRYAVRNRHILQKRRAMMDSKALDEIFAIA